MGNHRFAVLLGFALVVAAPPAVAEPDACATDADCGGHGLVCLERTHGECAEDREGNTECWEETAHLCGPTTCTSNLDCTGGTSCITFTHDDCAGCDPDDPADEDCEEECEITSESYCVPPFLAPCSVDADCGPGFTCEPEEECWGEVDGEGGEIEETCEPTGVSSCEWTARPCTSDLDCGAGLTCEVLGRVGECDVECDEDECYEDCQESSVSYCATPAFAAWSRAMAGGSDGAADRELGGGSGGDAPGSSGCAAGGSSAASLLGLLGAALFLRRR